MFNHLSDACSAAWEHLRKGFPRILLSSLIELLFPLIMGFATAPIGERIILYAQAYFGGLAQRSPELVQGALRSTGLPTAGLGPLVLLYCILLVTVYFLYTLIEGLVWAIAAQTSLWTYLKRFAFANLLWVPCYGIIHLLSLLADFQQLTAEGMGIAPPVFLSAVLWVLLIALSYFAFTDYALIPHEPRMRRRLSHSILRIRDIFPTFFLFGLVLFAVNIVLNVGFARFQTTTLIIGTILVPPLFLYLRGVWFSSLRMISTKRSKG